MAPRSRVGAQCGGRTHDHKVKSLALRQLSELIDAKWSKHPGRAMTRNEEYTHLFLHLTMKPTSRAW